jgi:hypothetical protein
MIRLEISGETAQEFGTQLAAVAQLMAGNSGGVMPAPAAQPEAPKPARGRPKSTAAEAAPALVLEEMGRNLTPLAEPSPTGDAAPASGAAKSDTSPAAPAGEAITRDSVAKKCTAYGQKGGPAALKELFVEMGSESGRWSGVPDENLAALDARLDDLLG